MTIQAEAQKREPDSGIVTFFTIDARPIGGSIFAFTHAKNGPIVFNGVTYQPIDFEIEGLEIRPDGEPVTPTLTVATTDTFIPAFIRQFDDGRGAIFTRLRTYRMFLDDGDDPDPGQLFPPEVYFIERKSRDNRKEGVLEWELSSILDQEGLMFPVRQVVRGYCDYKYRIWDPETEEFIPGECPYAGTRYYDRNGNLVTDPAKDACGKGLSDCKVRFGQTAVLPYRGFPGVGRMR